MPSIHCDYGGGEQMWWHNARPETIEKIDPGTTKVATFWAAK
jgi:hypothetical protein